MQIKKIQIHNWRSVKDVEINFENLMVFIGENNCGKSNILSAILFFFGYITCDDLDFCSNCDELYVEIEFTNLDDRDKGQFKKYLTSNDTIKVRKQINKGQTFEYHGYCEIPDDDWLKEEKASEYTKREVVTQTPLNSYVSASGRLTKDAIVAAQQQYIEAHKTELGFTYALEPTNFLGLKSVAQGIFGDVFFVPAVKDAKDEFSVKGKSVFNQLLTDVINQMSVGSQQYIAAKNQIAELTRNLNKTVADGTTNSQRPEHITNLERQLETELRGWNTSIDIEVTPPNIDDILKVGTTVWVDDGVRTDVNRKGNGLQRSLIFALIKAWAKVTQESQSVANNDDGGRQASKSTYFIFEEPELYLHPQAQRELFNSLVTLSNNNNQVLISTHSSSFIDLELHKSICIVHKRNLTDGTRVLQCNEELFDLSDDSKNFNLAYWMNPDRGELFFAKKVILLEGPTEKAVVPYLAERLGIFRHDFTLIDCGSKDSIPVYIHLLNKFKLSYCAVYDKDHQNGKNADAIASADISTQKIQDKLDSLLGTEIVFDNDIEEEIGIMDDKDKHKPSIALSVVSQPSFSISEGLKQKITEIFRA